MIIYEVIVIVLLLVILQNRRRHIACCLYGFETQSLTLREECRLRVFGNWVLRRIWPNRNDLTREWRRLHDEELHNLYCPPNVIQVIKSRRIRWVGHIACMMERRGAYTVLVGRPEGKRPLRRPLFR